MVQPREQLQVLLIEDSESDAGLITALLRGGDMAVTVDCAQSLAAGKELLNYAAFDVVLLDLNLPDASGLATFQSLYAEFPQVPIVVLSGLDGRELTSQALRAGAQDYLPKDRLDSDSISRAVHYAIERSQRQSAERHLRITAHEFETARRIQSDLLPQRSPNIAGFEIAGACRPALATGGDCFDYFPMANDTLGIMVSDVSSHGFAPALIMAGMRRVLRTMLHLGHAVEASLAEVNRSLWEDTQGNRFVTMFFGHLDPSNRLLLYQGAGHEAHLYDPTWDEIIRFESTGYPLGVFPHIEFGASLPRKLHAGQVLVLTTDGFREARNGSDQLFGMERVLNLVREHHQRSAQDILDALFESVHAFCDPQPQEDDITAVIVKVQ